MREPKLIGSDERVPCALTRRERDLITERTFIGPDLEARLRLGVVSGRRLVVNLTLDEVDELAGYVAAEANHCDDSKVQRVLDAVHDRLAKLENEYTDERPVRKESKPRVMPFVSRFTPKQGQYLAFM